MDTLPNDVLGYLFSHIRYITDARNLSKVCPLYNQLLSQHVDHLEKEYKFRYADLKFVEWWDLPDGTKEKYTVEIILDGYCHLIPEYYYSPYNKIIFPMLAFGGNFELLKVAHQKGCEWDQYAVRCASYSGHLDILEWLLNNRWIKKHEGDIYLNVVIVPQLKILDWLNTKIEINSGKLQNNAMSRGQISVLEWMESHGFRIEVPECYRIGTQSGHVHLLQWAKDRNIEPEESFYNEAVTFGHPNILDWALENGYLKEIPQWDWAIENEHTNVLDWALDHDYVLDDSFYAKVIKADSTEILKWAIKRGFELTKSWRDLAISSQKVDIINWMIEAKMITEPIILPITYLTTSVADLLLEQNLLQIDSLTYLGLIRFGHISLDNINEEYFVTKPQYHFVICNTQILYMKYGSEDNCFNQKITCCDNKGNYDIDDFKCGHKCWWYFWLFSQSNNRVFLGKIGNCDIHQKYVLQL
jgi:hypothetical protein